MSNNFLGQISLFPYNFPPRGWAFCGGQIMSIAQNTALFSLLGTTYGGNGQTTFALPDLRGRVPLSSGQGPGLQNYVLGELSGTESVTLTLNEIPSHNHLVSCLNSDATSGKPSGNILATGPTAYVAPPGNALMGAAMIQPAGGNQPHGILQPYLCLNYCIALQGIYPSRN